MAEAELSDELYRRVTELSERGNIAMDADEHDLAIETWENALALLPASAERGAAAMWLHASIGEALREKGETQVALDRFTLAYRCGDGFTNPFVLFSLGACHVDLGQPDEAVDPLLRAYMLEGEEIFGEDDQYLAVLRDRKLVD